MRSVWPVVGESLRETFEVDSRIFRTLKLLFLKPGRLSIEFSRNRRANYMSPFRLFLFACFVHLGVLAVLISSGQLVRTYSEAPGNTRFVEPSGEQVEAVRAKLAPETRSRLDDIMARGPDDLSWRAVAAFAAADPGGSGGFPPGLYRVLVGFYYDPIAVVERTARRMTAVLILSLPLYALILAVVYLDRRKFFVEHLVMATHLQCFSLVALLINYLVLPSSLLRILLSMGVFAGHILYYLMALRRYYGESWGKTFARWLVFAFLSSFVVIAGTIAAYFLG